MHAARKQAHARGHTSRTVSRSFSSTIESFLMLLLLEGGGNGHRFEGSRLTSLNLKALSLLLSLSLRYCHPRTFPARNSALLSTSPTALIAAALAISWRKPGAPTMVRNNTWWGWRGKVYTLPGAAWSKGLDILPGSQAQRALIAIFGLGPGNLPTQKPATYKPRS